MPTPVGRVVLLIGGTPEFTAPDDQGFVKHSALLQVSDQRGDRLVNRFSARLEPFAEIVVVIPAALAQFDKPDALLGHAAREQALRAEFASLLLVESVHGTHALGLGREIHGLGHRRLHAEGKLVGLNDAFHLIVSIRALGETAIQPLHEVDLLALGLESHASVADVLDGVLPLGHVDPRPLVARRQECGAVQGSPAHGGRVDRHESRQVLVLRAKSVNDPGSD